MKKRRTWQNKLTKAELKHLKNVSLPGTRITLYSLENIFELQAQMRRKESGLFEPCFMCKGIARKLGFEV